MTQEPRSRRRILGPAVTERALIGDQIARADCIEVLNAAPPETVHLCISDPPYNIGFDYDGEYNDSLPPDEYATFSENWLRGVHRVLCPTGTLWVVIGDEWVSDIHLIARRIGFHMRSMVVWYYTFGVNSPRKLARSHAHLLYLTKHKTEFTFNADQIRVPSARSLVYADKRANPDGRLPDDTWIIRPQDIPEGFAAESDTWYVSRVCGTFKERQEGAKNQLPEQLVGRIIRACSHPGQLVLDPMCGTGTVPAVAKKLGRAYFGIEQSGRFATMSRERCQAAKLGDSLDGVVPQGG